MNYLQLNDSSRFDVEEKALAEFFGEGNYTTFYKKHLLRGKINLTKDDFIAGEIDSMFAAMKQLKIDYHYEDYPECLNKYLHRKIWTATMSGIKYRLLEECFIDPVFIKPKNNLKKFTGFVLESIDDLYKTNHAKDSQEIICSEPVVWLTEYRVPVINGQIRDYCNYSGDKSRMVDTDVVQNMVNDFKASPKAYCIDVGVLSNGETALIEVNDAFSVGKYSMSNELYAELLMTRWNELKSSSKM